MDKEDEALKKLARQEPARLPEGFSERLAATLSGLPEKPEGRIRRKKRPPRWAVISVAAVLAIVVVLPNVSPTVARALVNLPVIGPVVEVVTFRRYTYTGERSQANVEVPELTGGGDAESRVNASIRSYTDMLIERFKQECSRKGDGYLGLDVSYKVVTDTSAWFTLRITAVETQASGYEFSVYYNIDKQSGKVVNFSDLFRDEANWRSAVNGEILRQMKTRTNEEKGIVFFPEDFHGVGDTQNYYFSASGELVIVFNEYDVAPGSMGCPEFAIPQNVTSGLMR